MYRLFYEDYHDFVTDDANVKVGHYFGHRIVKAIQKELMIVILLWILQGRRPLRPVKTVQGTMKWSEKMEAHTDWIRSMFRQLKMEIHVVIIIRMWIIMYICQPHWCLRTDRRRAGKRLLWSGV